jgi:DNA repair exonuclease SbcCD nuclease subunit
MIKTICHLADIHLPKSITRHDEYRNVFNKTYSQLKKDKPDRIVIVGDLFQDFLDMQGEQIILAKEFLTNLSKFAPVVITRGNHDIKKANLNRTDSIEAIVKVFDNKRITYLNETGFHDDDNVTWAVWKHGEKNNNPWQLKEKKYPKDNVVIDLFHNPIGGAVSPMGYEFNSKNIVGVKDLRGKFSFLGDIHKKQTFANKTKAYSSSLIEQNFAEGDGQFHGYLLWDIINGDVVERPIENDFVYNSVIINQFTDFDDLDLEVANPKPEMKIRILWETLPASRTKETERKVVEHLKNKFVKEHIQAISHKNEFIIEDKIIISEEQINDITDENVQEEVFRNYLSEIGTPDDIIEDVIEVDKEITSRLSVEELTSIQWDIIKFKATNFMSYRNIEIDWRDMDGLYQITGLNTAGKCVDPDTEIEIEFDENEIIKKIGYLPANLK